MGTSKKFPQPTVYFDSLGKVDQLTPEQARTIMKNQAVNLQYQLEMYLEHGLSDDGLDYLEASTTCWHELLTGYFDTDGDDVQFTKMVKSWLQEDPKNWGASDGDIRYGLFSPDYYDPRMD